MSRLSFLVSGMVAGVPAHGGASWAVLQYLLGLRRLGHDVLLVEPVVMPAGTRLAGTPIEAYCEKVMGEAGLGSEWALLVAGARETAGRDYDEVVERARTADVVLNVSGMLADEELVGRVPIRAYLDLDPAFNQLWHATQGVDMRFSGHSHFVTVGLAVGSEHCSVPTCDRRWITTLPPVVLDEWPAAGEIQHPALTTVANFRAYGSIEHAGVHYGQKVHSLRSLIDLPRRSGERFLLALSIHPDERDDLRRLREHGWELIDPASVAGTPADYRRFVQGSKAELGLTKSGYVLSRSGWFSDRSACYLASGRPVVAQDTGFSDYLPTGVGLLSFADTVQAADAIQSVNADYEAHRAAARALAEQHFDSDVVLTRLIDQLGAA